MADASGDASSAWECLLTLMEHEESGLADVKDVVAALLCTGRSHEQANHMLPAHGVIGDMVGLGLVRQLVETSIVRTCNGTDYGEVTKFILGILKQLERAFTARGEFKRAAQARQYRRTIKESEETRRYIELNARQNQTKSGLQEAQTSEAVEFNRAWMANMDEYEQRASQILQELKERHAVSLEMFIQHQRYEMSQRMKHSKAVLDLMQAQRKLAKAGKYTEAQRCQRKLEVLKRQEEESMLAMLDEVLLKKVEAFKSTQRLEIDALLTRIERGRSEHRRHWTQKAQRLMQAHMNRLRELSTRQNLENTRAAAAIKADINPVVKTQLQSSLRVAASPRGSTASRGSPRSSQGVTMHLPPPRSRPSKLPLTRIL